MNLFSQLFGPSIIQIEAVQVKESLGKKGAPLVLDVRQPEEYRAGHIVGSKLIPLGELGRRIKELPSNREIVCVCRSGNRSSTATHQLQAAGYRVANLRGGMIAWNRAGLPVKKGSA